MAITLKGIKLFPKKETQPDFVIASGVITLDDLRTCWEENSQYLTEYNGKKQMRVQVLRGKDGSPYMTIDTYQSQVAPPAPASQQGFTDVALPDTEGLPF